MRTRNQSTTKPQLGKAIKVLTTMAVNVTTTDKEEAAKKLGVHEITIRRYLKGDGKNLDTATRFIEFFSKRIEDRNKKITSSIIE